ncbi:MAG: hypothetical protein IT203_10730 [Fimbriimonadaceae bacterium]|nr:hypothetical protein [Fimbriimonadaceae bacterium]
MRKYSIIGLLALVSSLFLLGFMQSASIDRKQLREMLVQLGYEVSDLSSEAGKEKYSVKFTTADLNIPVGYEISPSGSYIWMTVNLGEAPKEPSAKCLELLKQNGKVQPTFFYITEAGRLMGALAVENRGVTNAILRQRSEFLIGNIGKTKDVWQK